VTASASIAILGERIIDLVPSSDSSDYRALPGGSPANVALAIARLGGSPLLLGRRAEDAFADLLDEPLRAAGLDLGGLIDAGGLSMMAVCTRQEDGSMAYSFYTADSPDLRWTAEELHTERRLMRERDVRVWHTGSLVSWLGPGRGVLLEEWHRARTEGELLLSFDPNARPQALSAADTREWVEQFAMTAHVVKASDEDLEFCYPDAAPDEVCARWVDTGPVIVVLTRGGDGATVWQRGRAPIDVPGIPVEVVDTVGAGDTLTGALLVGLEPIWRGGGADALLGLRAPELELIVSRAVAAAASNCTRAGASPPTLQMLDDFLVARRGD
jgi:fructokinase